MKIARTVALLFTTVMATCLTGIATTTVASAETCPEIELVWARGSGQQFNSAQLRRMNTELQKRLARSVDFRAYEVGTTDPGNPWGYPAVAVGTDDVSNSLGAFVSAGQGLAYGRSVNAGAKAAAHHVTQRHAFCPGTQFILGGFSQGAQVIGEALGNLGKAGEQVAFVALFGDPKLNLPEGKGAYVGNWLGDEPLIAPPACYGRQHSPWRREVPDCRTNTGSLGTRKPYLPATWSDRTGLWCNHDDFVCGASHFLWKNKTHTYFEEGGPIVEGAAEAITRLVSRIVEPEPDPDPEPDPEPDPGPEPAPGGDFDLGDFDTGRDLIGEGTTGLDVVFVLDSTGSMTSTIEDAKDYAATMADQVKELRGRVALVEYRDAGDEFVSRVRTDFTEDTSRLDEELGEIVADGGGDPPEALLHALMTAFNQLHWRDGATKAAIVLTDTSFHDPDVASGVTSEQVAARSLEIDPVNVYPVVPASAGGQYAELAELTSGQVVADTESTLEALDTAMTKLAERPVALLPLREYWAAPGLPVTFDASRSYAHHGKIESYEWDFDGDGTFEPKTTTPPRHVLVSPRVRRQHASRRPRHRGWARQHVGAGARPRARCAQRSIHAAVTGEVRAGGRHSG